MEAADAELAVIGMAIGRPQHGRVDHARSEIDEADAHRACFHRHREVRGVEACGTR